MHSVSWRSRFMPLAVRSFPPPLSVYEFVYGSFSFPLGGLRPNQTDDAKLLHFTGVRFSRRVHIVNIVVNKLLRGVHIFLNSFLWERPKYTPHNHLPQLIFCRFCFSCCKLNFSPIIVPFTHSSGTWKQTMCNTFVGGGGDFSLCHHELPHYAPLCALFCIWKTTKLSLSAVSGNHETIAASRAKHSQKFSYKAGEKMHYTCSILYYICQEWKCHCFFGEGQVDGSRTGGDTRCHHFCQTCPFSPGGSSVDWQIFLLLVVEKQRESRALVLRVSLHE